MNNFLTTVSAFLFPPVFVSFPFPFPFFVDDFPVSIFLFQAYPECGFPASALLPPAFLHTVFLLPVFFISSLFVRIFVPPVFSLPCISSLHLYLSIAIITTMLNKVFFVINSESGSSGTGAAAEEAERAVRVLEAEGIESGIIRGRDMAPLAEAERRDRSPEHTLFLCDTEEDFLAFRKRGFYAVGYVHGENASERFPGASYIIQEPDLVDIDSYVKIYEREAGLPWTILRTPRCLVREFTADDLDGIYALYDGQARQYLEPPSADRTREKEVLEAYIERIYGLYGFGHWAVLALDPQSGTERNPGQNTEALSPLPVAPGTLIGRIGFSAVTSEREAEASALGLGEIDADFGFLVAASCRGTGAAQEVCAAILRYGFEALGFSRVTADADPHNRASIRLLKKLGFREAGKTGEKNLYILSGHELRNCLQ